MNAPSKNDDPTSGDPTSGDPTSGDPTSGDPDASLQRSADQQVEDTGINTPALTQDEGPGWMPAILAAMALLGMIGFLVCAVSTWVLFQKRTEFAIRTLEGDYLNQVEQSLLDPKSKSAVTDQVNALVEAMQQGRYEDWQSAAIMQRIQRLPVVQWGDLQAIDAFLGNPKSENLSSEEREQGQRQLSRVRRAVELDKVTSFDFQELLKPVHQPSKSSRSGSQLISPLKAKEVLQSINQAKALADRAGIPDEDFPNIQISVLLKREVELGASEGGY